jgi:hypothetical protein
MKSMEWKTKDVATLCNVTTKTVIEWVYDYGLPAFDLSDGKIKEGKKRNKCIWRFVPDEVRKWLESRRFSVKGGK